MTVVMTMVKLEEGNFLTNWTLHPDEVAAGVQSAIDKSRNDLQLGLGKLAWQNVVEAAMLGETVISGGKIKTTLIDVVGLQAEIVMANYIEGLAVNFRKGTIGGFQISDNRIGADTNIQNVTNPNGLALYNNFIKFSTTNVWAGIGENVLPATLGGVRAVARFENHVVTSLDNYALTLSTKGSTQENHAIAILSGFVSGLSVKPKVITTGTASYTITNADVFLTCYNQATLSLYLPSAPETGKIVFIRKINSSAVNVYGNGKTINNFGTDERSSIEVGDAGNVGLFFYDGQRWTYNWFGRK